MPASRASGRIKGAAFREFLGWYGATHGGGSLDAVVGRLAPEWRALVDERRDVLGIIASDWYPAPLVHALLDAVTLGLSKAEQTRLADHGARAVMDGTLRGIYRTLFAWMATPERYMRFGSKIWSAYYDSGAFDIQMPDPRTAVCTVGKWDTHHPFICELNRGAAAPIYEAMGCKSVRVVRTECVGEGAEHCRFVSTWASGGV